VSTPRHKVLISIKFTQGYENLQLRRYIADNRYIANRYMLDRYKNHDKDTEIDLKRSM